MIKTLLMRYFQGNQSIPDVFHADVPATLPGFPVWDIQKCDKACSVCEKVCPTNAISAHPQQLDLGKCVFCQDCVLQCPQNALKFTPFYQTATTHRDQLVITPAIDTAQFQQTAITVKDEIFRLFGRSLQLRQVSAGGCNGCEMELHACSNVNFNMARFGIEFTASPRHADGIVITGPISQNMATALDATFQAIPEPRLVIVAGTCAISGGVFSQSECIDRQFLDRYSPDLYIPGCPVHPLAFITGLLKILKFKETKIDN